MNKSDQDELIKQFEEHHEFETQPTIPKDECDTHETFEYREPLMFNNIEIGAYCPDCHAVFWDRESLDEMDTPFFF